MKNYLLKPHQLSLYIHIPFCKSKCFYCSFTSFDKKDDLIEPYLKALGKEAQSYRGSVVDTVYIGGGTPTYLSCKQLECLFEIIRCNFKLADDAEITIEANLATFDIEKAKTLFSCGINRVSLGVQSLNDVYLKFLGRLHTSAQAQQAFAILRKANFSNINLDLIYSLPGQNKKDIIFDVDKLSSLGSEHISLYTLSVERGSEFYRKNIKAVNPQRQGEDYSRVVKQLKEKKFNHYEISNFAKLGFECRHNLNYWSGGNYIGLGVAAHSHIDGVRFWNTENLEKYTQMIGESGLAKAGEEKLGSCAYFMETFLIGLRLTQGVDIPKLEKRLGVGLPNGKQQIIDEFVAQGFLEKHGQNIKATLKGLPVLDELCSRLV